VESGEAGGRHKSARGLAHGACTTAFLDLTPWHKPPPALGLVGRPWPEFPAIFLVSGRASPSSCAGGGLLSRLLAPQRIEGASPALVLLDERTIWKWPTTDDGGRGLLAPPSVPMAEGTSHPMIKPDELSGRRAPRVGKVFARAACLAAYGKRPGLSPRENRSLVTACRCLSLRNQTRGHGSVSRALRSTNGVKASRKSRRRSTHLGVLLRLGRTPLSARRHSQWDVFKRRGPSRPSELPAESPQLLPINEVR